ncbi:MAG: putative oxidoreductase [Algoriphagus sp.]|jgi:putative oxidoreductase
MIESVLSPLSKISKYLIALPAALFGVFHFLGAEKMAGMVPIPGGVIWVYITGVAFILAAVAIIIGKKARLAATLLAVMLLVILLTIHLPAVIAGGGGDQAAMSSLLKDLMISGGVLTLASTLPVD